MQSNSSLPPISSWFSRWDQHHAPCWRCEVALGGRARGEPSEDVLGLDGGGGAHRSSADSPSDTSYFISGFGLLPPHCAVINTAARRPVFFSLLVPRRCLSVSPDKRRALPKRWFPIDFSLIRHPSVVTPPPDHCSYLQESRRHAAPSRQSPPEPGVGGGHLATPTADGPPCRGRQRGQGGERAASVLTWDPETPPDVLL